MASLLASLSSRSFRLSSANSVQEAQSLEGYLKKRTSTGIWHKRYFFVRGGYLLHKHEKSSSANDEKESLYFGRQGIQVTVSEGNMIEISFDSSSEVQLYLADTVEDASRWAKAIQLLVKNYLGHKSNNMLEKSGWLLKKSGSMLQPMMQDRYFRIDNGSLKYYKKEHDKLDNALGTIDIVNATFVRPYDLTPACTTFEIQDFSTKRIYLLQASDHFEMSNWVAAMDLVRVHAKVQQEQNEKARILADTPEAVQIYDSQGEKKYLAHLREEINEIYHISDDSHGAMSLGNHIECGEALIKYLKQEIKNIKNTSIRPIRYEIQALLMEEINVSLSFKMFSAVQSDSPTLTDASLADLHSLILLLTSYQKDLAKIFLPQASIRPNTHSCGLFSSLPTICERYINGGPDGSPPGAVSHLLAHCNTVWDNFIANPVDMLQRHNDGTFYTFNPTDMWEAMNQHISLATSTRSEILHIMIANKIVGALNNTVSRITDFIENVDISADADLSEIQLEFFAALANDNALHIEEICAVVDHFDMDEIRGRINDMYDSVTLSLVSCGQACLRRLASIIMSDVNHELEKVLTEEWLDEGRQVQVAVATISDYIGDLHTFLLPFWRGKFNYFIVEAVVVKYTSCVLAKTKPKRMKAAARVLAGEAAPEEGVKTLSRLMAWGRAKVEQAKEVYKAKREEYISSTEDQYAASSLDRFVCIDAESLGRIAQDVNVLNGFFVRHSGSEDSTLFLSLIGEVQHFLVLPLDELCHHALRRITEYPSSAASIYDVAYKCIDMREDIDAEDIEEHLDLLKPALLRASELAQQYESEGVGEGQLGLLYLEVGSRGAHDTGNKVAQNVRNFAKIPLDLLKNKILQLLPGVREDKSKEKEVVETKSARSSFGGGDTESQSSKERGRGLDKDTERLIGDVIDLMQNEDDTFMLMAQEEERLRREEELERKWATESIIGLESYLEKKSPTSNLWQKRWFKVATKSSIDNETDKKVFEYTLMWYKKQGGAVIRAVNVDSIAAIIVVKSSRNLIFSRSKNLMMLESEAVEGDSPVPVVQCKDDRQDEEEEGRGNNIFDIASNPLDFAKTQLKNATKIKNHFHFNLIMQDDRVHLLKSGKVDKLIKWINTLAKVCHFSYDEEAHCWSREAYAAMLNSDVEGSAVADRIRQSVMVNPLMMRSMRKRGSADRGEERAASYRRARWQGAIADDGDEDNDEDNDEGGEEDDDTILHSEQPVDTHHLAHGRRNSFQARVEEMADSNSSFTSQAPPPAPVVHRGDLYDDDEIFERDTDGGDSAKQRSASGHRIPMVHVTMGGSERARSSQGSRNRNSDCGLAEQRGGSAGGVPTCSVFTDMFMRSLPKSSEI